MFLTTTFVIFISPFCLVTPCARSRARVANLSTMDGAERLSSTEGPSILRIRVVVGKSRRRNSRNINIYNNNRRMENRRGAIKGRVAAKVRGRRNMKQRKIRRKEWTEGIELASVGRGADHGQDRQRRKCAQKTEKG